MFKRTVAFDQKIIVLDEQTVAQIEAMLLALQKATDLTREQCWNLLVEGIDVSLHRLVTRGAPEGLPVSFQSYESCKIPEKTYISNVLFADIVLNLAKQVDPYEAGRYYMRSARLSPFTKALMKIGTPNILLKKFMSLTRASAPHSEGKVERHKSDRAILSVCHDEGVSYGPKEALKPSLDFFRGVLHSFTESSGVNPDGIKVELLRCKYPAKLFFAFKVTWKNTLPILSLLRRTFVYIATKPFLRMKQDAMMRERFIYSIELLKKNAEKDELNKQLIEKNKQLELTIQERDAAISERDYYIVQMEDVLGQRDQAMRESAENTVELENLATQLLEKNQQIIDVNEKLREAYKEVAELSITDDLTGLHTRRYFKQQIKTLWSGFSREPNNVISILMLDVNKFKEINDTYGHAAGDHALIELAKLLRINFTRSSDIIFRFGGDEFAVVVCNMQHDDVLAMTEAFRQAVAATEILFAGQKIPLSVSIGVATQVPYNEPEDSGAALLAAADKLLYKVKLTGRNSVCGEILDSACVDVDTAIDAE